MDADQKSVDRPKSSAILPTWQNSPFPLEAFEPLALFLFALAVRLGAARLTHFSGLYGQDSFAYYAYAQKLGEALNHGQTPPPFTWPIGYPFTVWLTMLVVGVRPLAAQGVSMVAGALIAPLVYGLVRQIWPAARVGAVVAGLLTAVAGQLLISSLSAMSDTLAIFWLMVSACALARFGDSVRWRWLVLAALGLALAVVTRWIAGLAALPWALAGLYWAWQGKLSARQVVVAGATAVAIGLVVLGLQFSGDWVRGTASHMVDLEVYTWNLGNAFKQDFFNTDGAFHYERPIGLYYFLPLLHPSYVFPFFTPFLAIGLWAAWQKNKGMAWLLGGWLAVIYLLLAGGTWQNWRFPVAYFPAALVLVGLGIQWVWEYGRPLRRVWLVLWGVGLLGSALWGGRDVRHFTGVMVGRAEVVAWVGEQVPATATLIAFDLTAEIQFATPLKTLELFTLRENDLADLLRTEPALFLLVNPDSMAVQWADESPGQNFRWLQAHTLLVQNGRYPPYVLYQVLPKTSDGPPLLVAP